MFRWINDSYNQFIICPYQNIIIDSFYNLYLIVEKYFKYYIYYYMKNIRLLRQSNLISKSFYRSIWSSTQLHNPINGKIKNVTLIPGIGIGKQITKSVIDIFQACNVPVKFDILENFNFEDQSYREKVKRNKCILLGVMVPQKGVKAKYNDNHKFYKYLDLYTNINLAFSMPSVRSKHSNVDIAIIRQNTEGQFSGIEHEVYPGVMESLKVTTKKSSARLIQYAFQFAHFSGRKKISVIHKANIMKLVDGLFLQTARQISKNYPFIKYEQMIVDNCSMQLVKNPSQFDVMVAPNLYGTILSHICAGITGGVGMTPGACIGTQYALFSQGLPHSGMSIAGKNIVNPTSITISSIMMLRYLGLPIFADKISVAMHKVLSDGKIRTIDIGGNSTTEQYTQQIIHNL